MRTHFDIIVHLVMLEEELCIAPKRANLIGARRYPADHLRLAPVFGRFIVAEHFEHDCVDGYDLHLILKVVLVLVRPPVDIVRLHFQLEWPMWRFFRHAILVE